MVNKCVVRNYSTGYKTGRKKASFYFPEDQELKRKCIYFVNRKDWSPTAHSYVLIILQIGSKYRFLEGKCVHKTIISVNL